MFGRYWRGTVLPYLLMLWSTGEHQGIGKVENEDFPTLTWSSSSGTGEQIKKQSFMWYFWIMNYLLEYFVVPRRWFALSRIPSKCCFMQETKMIIGQKKSKSGQRRISKLCNKINSKIDFVKITCNLTLCFACFCL